MSLTLVVYLQLMLMQHMPETGSERKCIHARKVKPEWYASHINNNKINKYITKWISGGLPPSLSKCSAGLLHSRLSRSLRVLLPCISPHWGYYLHTSLPSPPQMLPSQHVTLSHPATPLCPQAKARLLVGFIQRLNWVPVNHEAL